MTNPYDDDTSLLVRKTSQDKLTYKNVIQQRINWCLMNMGTTDFPRAVKSLERCIIFDIPGFKFKAKIEIIHQKAELFVKVYEEGQKEKLGRWFFRRPIQAKLKIAKMEKFWISVYDEIIQLLAENKLLLDYEQSLSVKVVGQNVQEDISEEMQEE